MKFAWQDLIGGIGVVSIVLTYIALQIGKIRSESLAYSLLNALGASFIIISLVFGGFNFSAFIVEFFWLLISLFGVGKYFLKRK